MSKVIDFEEFLVLNTLCLFKVSRASGNHTQNNGRISGSSELSDSVETSCAPGAIPNKRYLSSPNLLLKYHVPLIKY